MDENLIVRLEEEKIVTATFRRLAVRKRRKLFEAVIGCVAARPFERVTLDNLAAGAGVSKGSLIQYFTTKENLLLFAAELAADEYHAFCDSYFAREQAVRVRERLEKFFEAHFDYWHKAGAGFRFYIRLRYESGGSAAERFGEDMAGLQYHHLAAIIRRGVDTGEIRRDLGLDHITFVFLAILEELTREYAVASKQSRQADIRGHSARLIALVLDGVRGKTASRTAMPGSP